MGQRGGGGSASLPAPPAPSVGRTGLGGSVGFFFAEEPAGALAVSRPVGASPEGLPWERHVPHSAEGTAGCLWLRSEQGRREAWEGRGDPSPVSVLTKYSNFEM